MQHQKAIVKKKVPEGEVLAETGSFAALPMPSPLGVEGGTKCRMRGEQPLAPSSGAPSSVSSLRSSTPSPDRGKALVETGSGIVEGSILALSVCSLRSQPPCSPFCRRWRHLLPALSPAVTFLPGAGKIYPRPGEVGQGERLWQYGKAPGFAKGSPFGRAVTAGD